MIKTIKSLNEDLILARKSKPLPIKRIVLDTL